MLVVIMVVEPLAMIRGEDDQRGVVDAKAPQFVEKLSYDGIG